MTIRYDSDNETTFDSDNDADFRRSTHFLWVETSFEFDKIPPRTQGLILTAERNDFTVVGKILLFTITPRP